MDELNTSIISMLPNVVAKNILNICGNSQLAVYLVLLSGTAFVISMFNGKTKIDIKSPTAYQDNGGKNNVHIFNIDIKKDLTYKEYLNNIKYIVSNTYNQDNIISESRNKDNIKSDCIVIFDSIHNQSTYYICETDKIINFNIDNKRINCTFKFNDFLVDSNIIIKLIKLLISFLSTALMFPDAKLSHIEKFIKQDKHLLQDIDVTIKKSDCINAIKQKKENNEPILLKKGTTNENLFLIHDGSGDIGAYVEFASYLRKDINYWGIRADKIENYCPENITIEDVAAKYFKLIKNIDQDAPYYLAGWSIGGTIAFEIALLLEKNSDSVNFLGLIDSSAPQEFNFLLNLNREFNVKSEKQMLMSLLDNGEIKDKINSMHDLKVIYKTFIDYINNNNDKLEIVKKLIHEDLLKMVPQYAQNNIKSILYYINTGRTYGRAREYYRPKSKLQCPVHLFKVSVQSDLDENLWQHYCNRKTHSYVIDGDHYSIFQQPQVKKFADYFSKAIYERS